MLSWVPTLVIAGVVDRNPTATRDLCAKFNNFLAMVSGIIRETKARQAVNREAGLDGDMAHLDLDGVMVLPGPYFTMFAGQGRVRWHAMVAPPILAGIERLIAERGRGWLENGQLAKSVMLKPHGSHHHAWSYSHWCWQALTSIAIVGGNIASGFIISFYTPTVGLGCRSGSYLIFAVIALAAGGIEAFVERTTARNNPLLREIGWILLGMEVVNTFWLLWSAIAQTFGLYETCRCLASVWGPGGGYINFDEHLDRETSHTVYIYWGISIALANLALLFGLAHIVIQWCEQSFLGTEDYESARRGLMRVREWRYIKSWLFLFPNKLVDALWLLSHRLRGEDVSRHRFGWMKTSKSDLKA